MPSSSRHSRKGNRHNIMDDHSDNSIDDYAGQDQVNRSSERRRKQGSVNATEGPPAKSPRTNTPKPNSKKSQPDINSQDTRPSETAPDSMTPSTVNSANSNEETPSTTPETQQPTSTLDRAEAPPTGPTKVTSYFAQRPMRPPPLSDEPPVTPLTPPNTSQTPAAQTLLDASPTFSPSPRFAPHPANFNFSQIYEATYDRLEPRPETTSYASAHLPPHYSVHSGCQRDL